MNDLDASVLIMPQTSHTKTVYMMRHKSLRTRYHPKNRAQETITPGNEITQLQQETVLHLESLKRLTTRLAPKIKENHAEIGSLENTTADSTRNHFLRL
jgi:transposase